MMHHLFSLFRSQSPVREQILDWPEDLENDFEYYRDFFFEEQAADLLVVFDKVNIPYQFNEVKYVVDPVIVGQSLTPKFVLKIRSADFARANRIWEEVVRQHPAIPEDHYLYDFSTQELLNVVQDPQSWSLEDVVNAKMILEREGIPLDEEFLQAQQLERLEKLKAGKSPGQNWIKIYFAMAIFGPFIHIILTLAALGMGLFYWKDKTISERGEKFFTFNRKGRTLGKWLFFASWLALISFVVFKIFMV
ncbi:MAG: hypothetical protein KDC24_00860 [Saprospiraceae bacterium]|nr:hypothetical protein [Saprospiraceae bacterium]